MISPSGQSLPVDSGLLVLNEVAGHRSFTANPTQVPSPATFVRKCAGKNKQAECLQICNHPNTRWECAFESPSKEEFLKHCKNITKRNKWKDLVEQTKPDKEGLYRCVYYSTDRHHVENHFQKGSGSPDVANTPLAALRYKSMLQQQQRVQSGGSNSPGGYPNNLLPNGNSTPMGKFGHPRDNATDERDMKRMRQDATTLLLFQENQNSQEGVAPTLPDNMKTEEVLDQIEKRLEVPRELCQTALEKLHKNGFMIIGPLRALKQEVWDRLQLPLAIEQEIKNYIGVNFKQPYNVQYSPQQVTGWIQNPGNYYNQMGQYYNAYGGYEGADNAGVSNVVVENGDVVSDKDHKGLVLPVVVGEGGGVGGEANKDGGGGGGVVVGGVVGSVVGDMPALEDHEGGHHHHHHHSHHNSHHDHDHHHVHMNSNHDMNHDESSLNNHHAHHMGNHHMNNHHHISMNHDNNSHPGVPVVEDHNMNHSHHINMNMNMNMNHHHHHSHHHDDTSIVDDQDEEDNNNNNNNNNNEDEDEEDDSNQSAEQQEQESEEPQEGVVEVVEVSANSNASQNEEEKDSVDNDSSSASNSSHHQLEEGSNGFQ